VAGSLL